MAKKKDLGQYFTPGHVAEFMVSLSSIPKTGSVLEPSCGEGIFLKKVQEAGYKKVIGYEIDPSIKPLVDSDIRFESFVSADLNEKFDLVIGNPPYIRWKNLNADLKSELENNSLWNKYFNSLCDYLCIFVLKSVEALKDGGELIFITPEYWINTKHAEVLRNYLIQNGYFNDIIHFNETPIFDKVASSILIFKFTKSSKPSKSKIKIRKYHSTRRLTEETLNKLKHGIPDDDIDVFERNQFLETERWSLVPDSVQNKLNIFESKCFLRNDSSLFNSENELAVLGSIADIGNGMVSGLDKAFQIPEDVTLSEHEEKAVLNVVKAKNLEPYTHNSLHRYIFLNQSVESEEILEKKYPNFYNHLKEYKEQLAKRYNYNRQISYWDWVFLRSLKLFSKPQPRIFVPCKERISHKNYFRFAYVNEGIFPTQDVTAIFLKDNVKESIYYILALLNSEYVFEWLKHKGVVKGNIVEFSEKPLASIPIRTIDWNRKNEVSLHDNISETCKKYIESKDEALLPRLNRYVAELF